MSVKTFSFSINTKGYNDIIDVTSNVNSLLGDCGLKEGNVLIFIPGSTAGVTTIEYEPGLLYDYPKFIEKIIPSNVVYKHDETWHDGNGFSHVRAALQGASLTVPFADRNLLLGTWQQIIIVDFDNKPRNRKIIVQFNGE